MPNFGRTLDSKPQLRPRNKTTAIYWTDGISRCAVSNDGVPLVYHFPGAMKPVSTKILFEQLVEFGSSVNVVLPKCGGADGGGRGAVTSYMDIPGQIAGIFKMVKAWHAIGHPHEAPVVSSHVIKSGGNFSHSLELMAQLRLVSHRVNDLLEFADPAHHAALGKLRTSADRKHEFVRALNSGDPLLMEGREIMYNRKTGIHKDGSDPKKGWAVLVVVGHSKAETSISRASTYICGTQTETSLCSEAYCPLYARYFLEILCVVPP
ncbi:hypothetical protein B0H16DRAFT_1745278 [Mycena metata]|uniref:Uncharacterized protein n=1 Tax=Mycena metata TaxID=1033252 RepID=A0AAD7MDJ7_9AGAR|nr:hypothetical protein B0H16DRAFT_1745278 [Mycena metata]